MQKDINLSQQITYQKATKHATIPYIFNKKKATIFSLTNIFRSNRVLVSVTWTSINHNLR